MSAILLHASRSVAYVASDAGEWDSRGNLAAIRSKLHRIARDRGVLVARGSAGLGEMAARRLGPAMAIGDVAASMPAALRDAHAAGLHGELFVAGFNDASGKVECWYCATRAKQGLAAFQAARVEQVCSPLPRDGFKSMVSSHAR